MNTANFGLSTTVFLWLGIPLVASPIIYLFGRLNQLRKSASTSNGSFSSLMRWLSLCILIITWIPYAMSLATVISQGASTMYLGQIALQIDGLSLLLAGIVLFLSTLVTLYSGPYMAGEAGEEKYYAMLLAMTGVMIGLGFAGDIFNLWVWFEAMAVTSYLLVAFYRQQAASLEAGIKYLVQSAVGSVFVLFGIAMVMAQTGTLTLADIRTNAEPGSLTLVAAGAFFLIGFGVKIALAPMHTWLPDAHAQAPSGISALLSGVVIETGLVALLRVLAALAGVSSSWGILLMAFAALNMLMGNLLALRQVQVKRMLAFSSLSHVGYMVLGLGVAFYAHSQTAAAGAFFHLINHALMKGLAFLAAGCLLYSLHLAWQRHNALTIRDLAGAAQRYPLEALALSIALLALGGLPPLSGFMSKWQIFVAGVETGNGWIIGLVAFAALNSVLSLAYYAPVVNIMYRQQPSDRVEKGKPIPMAMRLPLILLSGLIIILGFAPGLLNELTNSAALALLSAIGH